MYHVLPLNDIKEHQEESTCHCQPKVKIEGGEMICIHNAFDKRELKELCFEGEYAPITGHVVQYLKALLDLLLSNQISKNTYLEKVRWFMEEYKEKYAVPPLPPELDDPERFLAMSIDGFKHTDTKNIFIKPADNADEFCWSDVSKDSKKYTIETAIGHVDIPPFTLTFELEPTEEQRKVIIEIIERVMIEIARI